MYAVNTDPPPPRLHRPISRFVERVKKSRGNPGLVNQMKPNQNQSNSNETPWSDCCSITLAIKHNRTGTFQ